MTHAALTPEAVETLISTCLLRPDEGGRETIEAEGIMRDYRFDAGRIAENADTIGALLAQLPDEFWAGKGGGWSLLNACIDRHGDQWTGLHQRMEELVCLGIAARKAKWMMRDLAEVLPGGMPYFAVF